MSAESRWRRGRHWASIAIIGAGEFLAVGLPGPAALGQGESPVDILAVRVREQGHTCSKPSKAVRDWKASLPNQTVWVLQCEGARYRVVLTPDMGAKIEKLGQDQ